jgi:hypothetical protein
MTHLSNVFKYISKFRHAGHQVGRKVGDMLEVLTYAAITADADLSKRLHIEPKLYGFTDAGHKVEFAILAKPTQSLMKAGEIADPKELIGFVECKKVGVEQTINSTFKNKYKNINYTFKAGDEIDTSLGKQGWDEKFKFKLKFNKVNQNELGITIFQNEKQVHSATINEGHRIIIALLGNKKAVVLGNEASLRDVSESLERCKILEVQSVSNGKAKVLLNDCLPGPQTPEKAKQAAFVGLDIRKLRFNKFDKRPNETELVSVLVLTEFSHWEQKSQNVVIACLDKVLIVSDEIIVEAFEKFEAKFGSDFYDKITKDDFQKDADVRRIALDIVKGHQLKIFEDVDDGKLKKFQLSNNSLLLIE